MTLISELVLSYEFCAILACPMLPSLCRHCNVILAEQCTKISDNDEEKWPLTLATKSVYDKIKFFFSYFFCSEFRKWYTPMQVKPQKLSQMPRTMRVEASFFLYVKQEQTLETRSWIHFHHPARSQPNNEESPEMHNLGRKHSTIQLHKSEELLLGNPSWKDQMELKQLVRWGKIFNHGFVRV